MAVLRQILLVDDPTGASISTSTGTRDALPGELHRFDVLAAALTRHTGIPAEVRRELPGIVDSATAVVVHAAQLERLLAEPGAKGAAPRTAVVDVPREAVRPTLERHEVAIVVERNQYWKWKTSGPADAAVYVDLRVVPRLRHEVLVTPLDGGRFGRIRIDGEDLPGLIADVLTTSE